jgi:hypothetical protein
MNAEFIELKNKAKLTKEDIANLTNNSKWLIRQICQGKLEAPKAIVDMMHNYIKYMGV